MLEVRDLKTYVSQLETKPTDVLEQFDYLDQSQSRKAMRAPVCDDTYQRLCERLDGIAETQKQIVAALTLLAEKLVKER